MEANRIQQQDSTPLTVLVKAEIHGPFSRYPRPLGLSARELTIRSGFRDLNEMLDFTSVSHRSGDLDFTNDNSSFHSNTIRTFFEPKSAPTHIKQQLYYQRCTLKLFEPDSTQETELSIIKTRRKLPGQFEANHCLPVNCCDRTLTDTAALKPQQNTTYELFTDPVGIIYAGEYQNRAYSIEPFWTPVGFTSAITRLTRLAEEVCSLDRQKGRAATLQPISNIQLGSSLLSLIIEAVGHQHQLAYCDDFIMGLAYLQRRFSPADEYRFDVSIFTCAQSIFDQQPNETNPTSATVGNWTRELREEMRYVHYEVDLKQDTFGFVNIAVAFQQALPATVWQELVVSSLGID